MVYFIITKKLPPEEKLLSTIPDALKNKGLVIREFETIKEAKLFIRRLNTHHPGHDFEPSVWKETGTQIKI